MIIECTNCHARYQYDESRFDGKPTKKLKCAKCAGIFEIANPASPEARFPAPASPPVSSTPAVGERTASRRKAAARSVGDDSTRSRRPAPAPVETKEPQVPAAETGKIGAELKLPEGMRLSVAILDGPGAGNVYRVDKPRIVIGRAGADLVIEDDEASRQHALLEIRETAITLSDLKSKNGTTFDGEKISGPVELHDKSEWVIGGTTFMLIVTPDA